MHRHAFLTYACVLLSTGCQVGALSEPDPQPETEAPFADPDEPRLPTTCPVDPDCSIGGDCSLYECPDYWVCEELEGNKWRCVNPGPQLPDQSGWSCEDTEAGTECRRPGNELPDGSGGGGWTCEFVPENEEVVCTDLTPSYPEGRDGAFDCYFVGGDEYRVCESARDPNEPGGFTCTEGSDGRRCEDRRPSLPDERRWECWDYSGSTYCRTADDRIPDGSGGDDWSCRLQGEFVVCATDEPEVPDDSRWRCRFIGESRVCEEESELPDESGREGWSCTTEEFVERCSQDDPLFPEGATDWTCVEGTGERSGRVRCRTSEELPDGAGGDGWECVRELDGTTCRHAPEYPDNDSATGWLCTYVGVIRTCDREVPDGRGDGGAWSECTPGVQRWCDDDVFCSWGKQTCLPDGTWGRCIEPIPVDGILQDRPDTLCACRNFIFNADCCETPDCIIPMDHVPPTCESDGSLCSFCDADSQCGEEPGDGYACVYGRAMSAPWTMCSRRCDDGNACPDDFSCTLGYCYPRWDSDCGWREGVSE